MKPVLENHVDISSLNLTALIMRWIYADDEETLLRREAHNFSFHSRKEGYLSGWSSNDLEFLLPTQFLPETRPVGNTAVAELFSTATHLLRRRRRAGSMLLAGASNIMCSQI
jgi:hypothetical protein